FKKGGFATAMDMGFPVLPVTVNGSRRILPKKSTVYHSGPIEVVIDEPIDIADYLPDRIDELLERTRSVIVSNFNPEYPSRRGP
ncbi:MAG: 1-acyl-sn-glycerol-3-phosphate acyltransferase, partial [Deltaproteobacteria bacterium]|nr:1-acyl-sn-glycerol-3-phosphate acyltransferase [Deltaproteobacteria bacterium]